MIVPSRLAVPHHIVRRAVQLLWLVALCYAVAAHFGGTWINYQRFVAIDAPFASIGLQSELNAQDGWGVGAHGLPGVAQSAAIPPGSLLGSVDGTSIDGQTPIADIADLIAKAGPSMVRAVRSTRSGCRATMPEPGRRCSARTSSSTSRRSCC